MWQAQRVAHVREQVTSHAGTTALVPTMGALHQGHLALIHRAAELADRVVVSIFVNPTQFGPNEDFTQYPRPLNDDLAACEAAGAHGVFTPHVDDMYPPDALPCEVSVPALADELEGAHRPGHFAGVCRVVLKLFNIVQPDIACFGMKDYQQLRVIQAMASDLLLPIRIEACPTLREDDGLAMSSRNRYLTPQERPHAVAIFRALNEARLMIDAGESDPDAVEQAMTQMLKAHRFDVDYAAVRHPGSLTKLDCLEPQLTGGVVALIAARIGSVRLIDNMVIAPLQEESPHD